MRRFFYAILACISFYPLFGYEGIELFHSTITIHRDGMLTVREEITVNAERKDIKRGIVREFPTTYKDRYGNTYIVSFDVQEVLRDGREEPYRVASYQNGVQIYIGNSASYLTPGNYTYTIEYTTNHHIGFFKTHDELYWNVTGNGWRLPIKKAIADIILPTQIPLSELQYQAFTGLQDSVGQAYSAMVLDDHQAVRFETTHTLAPYEGLTIAVGFPKGIIAEPTYIEQASRLLLHNMHLILFVIGLLYLICLWIFLRRKKKMQEAHKTIIPLFYPPKNISSGFMYYLLHFGYGHQSFAAEIVDAAVHGLISIESTESFWKKRVYTLTREKSTVNTVPRLLTALCDRLFESQKIVPLTSKNTDAIAKAAQFLEKNYNDQAYKLFMLHESLFTMSVIVVVPLLVGIFYHHEGWGTVAVFVYILLSLGMYYTCRTYTDEGIKLISQIEGFKMFLAATEVERLKLIGTPPERTPELYETYLPYAMALGVEEQWTKQFAPLFERMKSEGRVYHPVWYHGPFSRLYFAQDISHNLRHAVQHSISSSGTVPGSSSGFGGRGRSGGGSGGGGGGGW